MEMVWFAQNFKDENKQIWFWTFCVLQKRPISAPSVASSTTRGKKKRTEDDVLYKIAIITADKKDAGTDAKVCVIHQCSMKLYLLVCPILPMRIRLKQAKINCIQ